MKQKSKLFTIRIPQNLYEKYVEIALVEGKNQKRVINLTEVIIDALRQYYKIIENGN